MFKIGDRVIVRDSTNSDYFKNPSIGTVDTIKNDKNYNIYIKFDSGYSNYLEINSWYTSKEYLTLIIDNKENIEELIND